MKSLLTGFLSAVMYIQQLILHMRVLNKVGVWVDLVQVTVAMMLIHLPR
jgi:hypothetical protein